jgi:hypothetical protein
MVDLKVLPAFLRFLPQQTETVRRHLIGMLVNRMYVPTHAQDRGARG